MNLAAAFRPDLAERDQKYAEAEGLPALLSITGNLRYALLPTTDGVRHGNFLLGNHKAIRANAAWRKRFEKVHRGRITVLPLHNSVRYELPKTPCVRTRATSPRSHR